MAINCNSQKLNCAAILVFTLICMLQTCLVQSSSQFPKIVWVFWDSGFEKAPVPVQLSLKNMRDQLSGTGWEIRELSNANLHQYIDEQDEKEMVRESSIDWMISDQLRLVLLIKYGGVYLDSSCFLLENFDWLENIKNNSDVVNKYGEFPNVLLFHTTYQSSFYYRTFQNKLFLVSPGVQSWFIAATPNSTFLKLWLSQLRVFMIKGKEFIESELKANNIGTGALASDPTNKNHYFAIYEAFHSVVQKRQNQIDQEMLKRQGNLHKENMEVLLHVPLAVQQFGLWFIPAVKGPFKMMLKNNINFEKKGIQALTEFTQDQLKQRYGEYKYLVKLTGSVRKTVNKILQNPDSVKFSQNWSFSGNYACLNTFYFVKDSLFDKYLLSYMSPEQKAKITIVDKQSLPFLCQQSDIQYLSLWVETIFLMPLLIFIASYIVKKLRSRLVAKNDSLLETSAILKNENAESQAKQASALDLQKQKTLKYLKISEKLEKFELVFSGILTTIFLGSLILQLIGWCWQLLSNLIGLLPFQFLVLGWLIYSTIAIYKQKSSRSKNLLRISTLLILVSMANVICKFNLTFDDNLNEDTNNFYLYGVMVGLTGTSIVYWWVIATLITIQMMIKLTPIKVVPNDSNMQTPAKTQNLQMAQIAYQD